MPHVQVLWPDGSPTARLFRLRDAKVVAQVDGGTQGRQQMLQVLSQVPPAWLRVVWSGAPRVVGSEVHDDLLDEAATATLQTIPQACSWFREHGRPVPPELTAQAERFRADWVRFRKSAAIRARMEAVAASASGLSASTSDDPNTDADQVLIALALVVEARMDGARRLISVGYARGPRLGPTLEWIGSQVESTSEPSASTAKTRRAKVTPSEPPRSWEQFSPEQRAIVEFLLSKKRGEPRTRSRLFEVAGMTEGEAARAQLDRLESAGVLERVSERQGMRLLTVPAGTPEDVERHASWLD